MDNLAKAYKVVRDVTYTIPVGECIAMLDLIKNEVLVEAQSKIEERVNE